jgi:hypothetical protein
MWHLHIVIFLKFQQKKISQEDMPHFSKKERLANKELSIYDSFTLGDFLIEITINSDETKTHRIFELHVDRNYIKIH